MATFSWGLDPAHSEVQFKVKHLMMTNVTGDFPVINGSLEATDENFTDSKVTFTADVSSINTRNSDRDNHLKSQDFFDVEKFPSLSFMAEHFDINKGKVEGDLTIKDVTKPISLDVTFEGRGKDPWGNEKIGFSLSGKINRKEWGLTYNAALESGGVLVSEDVKIEAEVQFVKNA